MRAVPGNRALLASSALFCTCACARVPEPRTPVPNVASQSVVSTDVDAFWAAYDSARTTTDSLAQLRIVQSQYIDRATDTKLAAFELEPLDRIALFLRDFDV